VPELIRIDERYATAVTDVGDGPAVVLVHGTPLDAHAWDGLVPGLAGRHRVIAYDLRGHGSARACGLPASYEPLVDDLARLLDALEVERAHVVGHSFGGQVATAFALSRPQRVAALTVVCARSAPYPPFAAAADIIERDGIQSIASGALERWFTPEALARDDPAVAYARSRLTPEAAPTLATAFRLIARFDATGRLGTLRAPARYVAAEHDLVATPEDLRRAAGLAPRGAFLLEPATSHMLPVEHPERLARLPW
jgi:3-oxoadipate enol-lactonase